MLNFYENKLRICFAYRVSGSSGGYLFYYRFLISYWTKLKNKKNRSVFQNSAENSKFKYYIRLSNGCNCISYFTLLISSCLLEMNWFHLIFVCLALMAKKGIWKTYTKQQYMLNGRQPNFKVKNIIFANIYWKNFFRTKQYLLFHNSIK